MKVITNASPLIYLAKIGRLRLLKLLFSHVSLPYAVYREVVERGLAENRPDAAEVKAAVNQGWLKVIQIKSNPELASALDQIDAGEAETLSLARQEKTEIVLVDDGAARRLAKALGLTPHGTVYVILCALKRKHLSEDEAKAALAQLIEAGFRLSPEIYSKALAEIDGYGKRQEAGIK